MPVHILAGDALAADFRETKIDGEVIVCRECLIDGPVGAEPAEIFWRTRAKYLAEKYGEKENYHFENSRAEFEKIAGLSPDAEIYLWFEYELFCQVNMWFVLSLLAAKQANICRVFPSVRKENDKWKGFGSLTETELKKCFADRVKFSADDIQLGRKLWEAYRNEDLEKLKILSTARAKCFPYLKDVCEAEIERKRDQRPEKTLRKIAGRGVTDPKQVFEQFVIEEGVYGFGDLQVKAMHEGLKL